MNKWSDLADRIENMREEAINLMCDLLAINSIGPKNDGPGEMEKANFIKNYLNIYNIGEISEFNAPDDSVPEGERPNIIVKIPGKIKDKTLWIITHTDIVPEGDLTKWDTDPLKGVVKDGKIYGRGSEDNHQSLVSSIIMARMLKENNIEPDINIGLAFVADEETGSDFGLTYLMDNHAYLFKKDDLFIIPDAGADDSTMIEVAEKSIIWFKFNIFGKQVHASTPQQGVNAFKAASHFAVKLDGLHHIFDKVDPVFDNPHSTFEPTKKEANVPNINTIPGEDIFYLDCRVLPGYDISDVEKEVQNYAKQIEKDFNVKIDISTAQREQAAPSTPADAEIVEKLKKSVNKIYKVNAEPRGIGGGTCAAIIRRKNYKAAVWSTINDMAHQPNEYCVINHMINDAKVFALCAFDEI